MRKIQMNHSQRLLAYGRPDERGQAAIIMVLALAVFLLAFTGLAVDYSNLWFHRQAAQGAADAACQAGAMDMYVLAQGTAVGGSFKPGFTPTAGASLDCSSNSSAVPCKYAALNGYNGTGLVPSTESNDVTFSFPASVPGVTAPPSALASVPFMRVDVTDRVQVYTSALMTGSKTQDVLTTAKCGLVLANSPIPIIVLNQTASGTLSSNGANATISIYGGPAQSIQVNSSSKTAVSTGGTIDLSAGGPNGTGSNLGTFGGPTTATGTFLPGTTGRWVAPSTPIPDPFATIPAPAQPAAPVHSPAAGCTSNPCSVAYHVNGCPTAGGCVEYAPGYYPSVLKVQNATAIFDGGIYYLAGGLDLHSNSIVRPSTVDGSGIGGTMFYLTGGNSVAVSANSGGSTTDTFDTSLVPCPAAGSPGLPAGVPAQVDGNILLAPCVGTYGDPLGQNRGILFFQDRSSSASASWGGGGDFLLAGTMYFHQCHTDGSTLTGTGCSSSAFNTSLDLSGNSGSGTYLLGEIVADNISLSGNPSINMVLNPNATYNILKVALLQ